jgi:hypothetical protein
MKNNMKDLLSYLDNLNDYVGRSIVAKELIKEHCNNLANLQDFSTDVEKLMNAINTNDPDFIKSHLLDMNFILTGITNPFDETKELMEIFIGYYRKEAAALDVWDYNE